MEERRGCQVTGELGVPASEPPGEIWGTEPLQVHGQARGVIEAVQPAQPVIEIQAVEDPRPVVQAVDVVGEQIAMPVHDAACAHSGLQQPAPPSQILADQAVDLAQSVRSQQAAGCRRGLRDVVLPPAEERIGTASCADLL